jgi:hypothetical protein
LAEIFAIASAPGVVLIWKVAETEPPLTTTLAGTTAAALSLARVTVAPPCAAGLLRVTVPVELVPLTTLVGFTVIDEIEGGVMVKVVLCVPL